MVAHRIETTLEQDGTLTLENLPFHAGEAVEIIILAQPTHVEQRQQYPLRGTSISYSHPTEPVDPDEWNAAA